MIDSGYTYNEKQLLYTENVDQVEENSDFYSISTEVGLMKNLRCLCYRKNSP